VTKVGGIATTKIVHFWCHLEIDTCHGIFLEHSISVPASSWWQVNH